AIAQVQADLQHTSSNRRLTGVEGTADLLRMLGPLTTEERTQRLHANDDAVDATTAQQGVEELVAEKRAIDVRMGTQHYWAAIEDAPRLRDGLGIQLSIGAPKAFSDSRSEERRVGQE